MYQFTRHITAVFKEAWWWSVQETLLGARRQILILFAQLCPAEASDFGHAL